MKFKTYSTELINLVDQIDEKEILKIVKILWGAYKKKRTLFFAGNGGSASTASHIAADLGKNSSITDKPRVKSVSLADNISWITALGNDFAYEDIFLEQLKNFAKKGDLFFVFSVSGNSTNLVKAVDWANKNGIKTLGLLGKDGGKLKRLLHARIVIKSQDYGLVESLHSYIHHFLVLEMYNRIKEK